MKNILLFLLILTAGSVNQTFSQKLNVLGGINFGGPVPTQSPDSTTGNPVIGSQIGTTSNFKINEHFYLQPELYYSFEGVNYNQSFTEDTVVAISINGSEGSVPSFYTAYINGAMKLHYINLPILAGYRIGKSLFMAGPYFASLIGGRDAGDVRVVIGHGGFYGDITETFNNFSGIQKFECGVVAGANVCIYKQLSFEIKTSRSFFNFYKPGAITKGPNTNSKFFNTFVNFSLAYKFYERKKSEKIS